MKLIYYTTKDDTKSWIKAVDMEGAERFINEHPEIVEYNITCDINEYQHLTHDIKVLEDRIKKVKEFIRVAI